MDLIGKKVTNKAGNVGEIISIDECGRIKVEYADREPSVFQSDAFEKGFLKFVDETLQQSVNEENEAKRIAAEKAAKEIEEARLAAIEARKKAMAASSVTTTRRTGTRSTYAFSVLPIAGATNLTAMTAYGTVAKEIYDECCVNFGWDKSKSGMFGQQQKLWALSATPQKYDVWFLAHSNWTATKNGKWSNEIKSNGDIIEEHWDDELDPAFSGRFETRVVFAKEKAQGRYVFLGVYEDVNNNTSTHIRTYKRISKIY